jgi:hypothetical protein
MTIIAWILRIPDSDAENVKTTLVALIDADGERVMLRGPIIVSTARDASGSLCANDLPIAALANRPPWQEAKVISLSSQND